MSDKSEIEWTDATWNPVRGCVKISPGCKFCYAEAFAERFRGVPGSPYEQGFDPLLVPHKLADPLGWNDGRLVFVNSMSDLFGEFVPDEYIAATFGVMSATPWHTYQVLTKRSRRMPEWFDWIDNVPDEVSGYPSHHDLLLRFARAHGLDLPPLSDLWPLPNVWLGVSVEDRKYGLPRIEDLRRVPAALRFLSIEPLLEDLGEIDLTGIGWVIVGGESGNKGREMHLAWARRIKAQCREQGVPFFFKQAGRRPMDVPAGGILPARLLLKHRKGADLAELPEDLRVREMPAASRRAA